MSRSHITKPEASKTKISAFDNHFFERRIKIFMNVFCGHEGIITLFQAVNSIMKGNISDLAERIELNLPIVQP